MAFDIWRYVLSCYFTAGIIKVGANSVILDDEFLYSLDEDKDVETVLHEPTQSLEAIERSFSQACIREPFSKETESGALRAAKEPEHEKANHFVDEVVAKGLQTQVQIRSVEIRP